MIGSAADRATILLLKLEHALAKDEKDQRVGRWLDELKSTLDWATGAVSTDDFARLYKLNRAIWVAEDQLGKAAREKEHTYDQLVHFGRLALEVRMWNEKRAAIIATYDKFQDKI